MSGVEPLKIRIELARGHWTLREHVLALDCVEKAIGDDPDGPELLPLIQSLLDDGRSVPDGVAMRLAALLDLVSGSEPTDGPIEVPAPLATATVAALLAEQGHEAQARALADDLLRRNPDNARALQVRDRLADERRERIIATLERWLANAKRGADA